MKKSLSALIATLLIFSLISSAIAQTSSRRQRGRGSAAPNQRAVAPAVTIVSDRLLTNYTTDRNGDKFKVTIHQVGNFRTINNGQPVDQSMPQGTNELVLEFPLQPGTNPQLEQNGNQLTVFFAPARSSLQPIVSGVPIAPVILSQTDARPMPGAQPDVRGGGQGPELRGGGPPITRDNGGRGDSNASGETVEAITPKPFDSVASSESDEEDQCAITEPTRDDPKDDLLVIDANTGKVLEGSTRVGEDTRVKVVFVNKNPFKYDYNFQLVPKDVGGATVISFLGLLPGFPGIPGFFQQPTQPTNTAAALPPQNVAGATNSNQPGIAGAQTVCSADFQQKVASVVASSTNIAKALNERAKLLKDTTKAYTEFLKATDKPLSGGTYQARITEYKRLCELGKKMLPELTKVLKIDFDEFSKDLKLDLFSAQITILEADLGSSGCDETQKALYQKVIAGLKADATNYKTKLEEFKTALGESQKAAEPAAKIIKTALGSKGSSFAEAAYAPTLGDATSVTVTIARKNLREEAPKTETIAVSPPIEIGEPRIVLSGGIGFSSINERKIIRQAALVPGPTGTPILGNRFGFENRSQFRPSGIVLINGLLKRFPVFGKETATFALSAGLVLSNRNDGLSTEFIAGPSLGLANNKMFLTFGFHAARVEELSGDFKIGDPVPANLSDPLPLQKNWKNGLIMSLTFKIPALQ
jgi:hypothetical protein